MRDIEFFDHLKECTAMLDGFTILDKDGYYLYVSDSWSGSMGYTLEDLKGIRAIELFPDTPSPAVLETGQSVVAYPIRSWGKNRTPGIVSYYPFFDEEGHVAGCYCLVMLSGIGNANNLQNKIKDMAAELDFLRQELIRNNGAKYSLDQIIGNSPQIVELKNQIRKVARSNSSVLIEGETGVGKELVAHAIHMHSKRKTGNFVRVNCAAIPPELMESEFFGYTRGAFTGADQKGKIGRFQFADKGTIFLDEVNSLPAAIQPKFLRVLQEKEIEPVGSTESIPVDIRVIAASNTKLKDQVMNGSFRQDLYYRLNVVRLKVPPLRERKEDIPLLVEGLIQRLNESLGMYTQAVSPAAMRLLTEYNWPGNIRELQNALESAMNIAEAPILRKSDFYMLGDSDNKKYRRYFQHSRYDLQASKAAFEKDLITEVLEINHHNHAKSAEMLGISRTMLYKKLAQYEIE